MNDPIALLEADHREVEQLLESLKQAEPEQRPELYAQLNTSLRLHMDIEESHVYPLVAEELDEEDAEEANVEHALVREGLDKLESLLDAPGFDGALAMVKAGISHHVEEEEGEIFPELAEKLDEQERAELGDTVMASKEAGSATGAEPTSQAGKAKRAATTDDDEVTKQELLERAKKADIPGRSSMTKQQLQEALDSAES